MVSAVLHIQLENKGRWVFGTRIPSCRCIAPILASAGDLSFVSPPLFPLSNKGKIYKKESNNIEKKKITRLITAEVFATKALIKNHYEQRTKHLPVSP